VIAHQYEDVRRYHVFFTVDEARELRALGFLPRRPPSMPQDAKLWMTSVEIAQMATYGDMSALLRQSFGALATEIQTAGDPP
jgi:hypothetical protein